MTGWQPNTGVPPVPADDDAPPIDRVFVQLRNGMKPAESWPVNTDRHVTTRWSLTGHPFDIIQWRPS